MSKFLDEEGVGYLWSKVSAELSSTLKISDVSNGSIDVAFGTVSYGGVKDMTANIPYNVGDPLKHVIINVTGEAQTERYSSSGSQYFKWYSTFRLLVPSGGIWAVALNTNGLFYIISGGSPFWTTYSSGDTRQGDSALDRFIEESIDCYITRIL